MSSTGLLTVLLLSQIAGQGTAPPPPPGTERVLSFDRRGNQVAVCAVKAGDPVIASGRRLPPTEVWYMNGQVVRKTALGLGVCDPAWSPDGTRLAVTTAEGLWVISNVFVDKGDSGERLVDSQAAPGAKAEFAYVAFSKPSWSPDGSRLAFVATSGGGSWVEVVDAASGQRLAKSAVGPSDFRWATDSRSLTVGGTTLRVP